MHVAGIGEEFSEILGVKVDVVTGELLCVPVAVTAELAPLAKAVRDLP